MLSLDRGRWTEIANSGTKSITTGRTIRKSKNKPRKSTRNFIDKGVRGYRFVSTQFIAAHKDLLHPTAALFWRQQLKVRSSEANLWHNLLNYKSEKDARVKKKTILVWNKLINNPQYSFFIRYPTSQAPVNPNQLPTGPVWSRERTCLNKVRRNLYKLWTTSLSRSCMIAVLKIVSVWIPSTKQQRRGLHMQLSAEGRCWHPSARPLPYSSEGRPLHITSECSPDYHEREGGEANRCIDWPSLIIDFTLFRIA